MQKSGRVSHVICSSCPVTPHSKSHTSTNINSLKHGNSQTLTSRYTCYLSLVIIILITYYLSPDISRDIQPIYYKFPTELMFFMTFPSILLLSYWERLIHINVYSVHTKSVKFRGNALVSTLVASLTPFNFIYIYIY